MNIITDFPPTLGTTIPFVWEGYARTDEIVPGDEVAGLGTVTMTYRVGEMISIAIDDDEDLYYPDETLYIVRTVNATFTEA